MLRQARIDAPGALHHAIVRGIERRRILLLGMSATKLAWRSGMTQPAVSVSVKRGENLANAKGLTLLDK